MAKLTIYRGDTKSYQLNFTDSDGDAIDITGYTIFMTVKAKTDIASNDTSASISKTVTSHTNAAGGITTVTLSSTDTDITKGDYKYDFQFKDTSNNITTIQTGIFEVMDDVTKRES